MSNILPFKSKSSVTGIYITISWDILEDGSVWYKIGSGDWVKLEMEDD